MSDIKRPEDCLDMGDIRAGIDALDARLVALFSERMGYIRRAGAIKKELDIPANVPVRVEDVVSKVRAHAEAHGLDADLYETIWRSLIAHAIETEETILADDSATGGQ